MSNMREWLHIKHMRGHTHARQCKIRRPVLTFDISVLLHLCIIKRMLATRIFTKCERIRTTIVVVIVVVCLVEIIIMAKIACTARAAHLISKTYQCDYMIFVVVAAVLQNVVWLDMHCMHLAHSLYSIRNTLCGGLAFVHHITIMYK